MVDTRLPPSPTTARASVPREVIRPAPWWVTGARLPEVRWAAIALACFAAGGLAQLAGAPPWVWWSLYLVCGATGGWQPAVTGLRALRDRSLDVDLLMVVAAVVAVAIGEVLDAALLIVIFSTSGALEALVTRRTADSVLALLDLAPERATRLHTADGREVEEEIGADDLAVGDLLLVRPGERVAADALVVRGRSEVDQAALTGEPLPVLRETGDELLSGSVNGSGVLRARVERPAGESVLARIVTLVEAASETKARRQLFIERIEQRYSTAVVVATLALFVAPLALGSDLEAALLRAITFMIVASPCAVVLSTMPPLLAAIANAGRHGVLVKSAIVMEEVGHTDTVVFDKTGTLTEGAPQVVSVVPHDTTVLDREELLRLAAAAERESEHPIGRSVVAAAKAEGLDLPDVTEFASHPGIGVTAMIDGRRVRVGRRRGAVAQRNGLTEVAVEVDGATVGVIGLVDRVRPAAGDAVSRLAALTSNDVELLTGDHLGAADRVAVAAGITHVRSQLLPEDKVRAVRDGQGTARHVLYVGDGINDAPAIAAADTGIAMGRRGSDLTLQTADAILVRDELDALPALVLLSRRARRVVLANLVIAGTVIVSLVTWDLVASLPLPLAVAGHEGSTVVVALNGLRLLRRSAWPSGVGPTTGRVDVASE